MAVGGRAERLAQRFLERKGLRLVTANYRCRLGELDLVMTDGEQLVIVEVRYRARAAPVDPALTVTAIKRLRLLRATAHFLHTHPRFRHCGVRMDVVAITGPVEAAELRWLPSAFNAEDMA
jgi:putative endonuclease